MNQPPDHPPSTDRTACIQWFQDWVSYGLENPSFTSDWIHSDNDTQEYFGLSHKEFLMVRLLQRILKLEKVIDQTVSGCFQSIPCPEIKKPTP